MIVLKLAVSFGMFNDFILLFFIFFTTVAISRFRDPASTSTFAFKGRYDSPSGLFYTKGLACWASSYRLELTDHFGAIRGFLINAGRNSRDLFSAVPPPSSPDSSPFFRQQNQKKQYQTTLPSDNTSPYSPASLLLFSHYHTDPYNS